MSGLERARGWFIAPPPGPPSTGWSAPPGEAVRPDTPAPSREPQPPAADRPRRRKRPPRPVSRPPAHAGWQPPVADDPGGGGQENRPQGKEILATPAPPPDLIATPSALEGTRAAAVTSAAVLGRPGEVEPVAAALALALRLQTRAKAAAVAVVGAAPPAVEGASSAAAARRLAARLEAHGHEPRVRGRLAWLELDPSDPQFAAVARRVTLIAAPAVLAVTAARTVAVDEALNEQDLLILVTGDPESALARLALAGLTDVPILTVRPLGRGPARALARAGVRPARTVRQLLTEVVR